MRNILALTILACAVGPLHAALPARAEIDGLLAGLGASQCQFYRNGKWHDGRAAESHLRMKYEHLQKQGAAPSAETFIDEVASRSSLSGEAYAVRCGAAPQQPSGAWLRARLQALRG